MPPPPTVADFDLDPYDDLTTGREEESLFARDDNDVLVRREKETRDRFREEVTVSIDGFAVTVPRAVPKTDALGNPLKDADGQLIPRTTTIYDAATRLVRDGAWTDDDLKGRIPVLCHAPHMTPVGMCRMCSVHISSIKRGKLTPGRKLVPACQHRVETDMVVTTRAGADGHRDGSESDAAKAVAPFARGVNSCVSLLAEFLLADHRHPDPTPVKRYDNELEAVALTLGVAEPRPILPRNPGGAAGRNHLPDRYPRARRIALPVVPTPVEPERLSGDAAMADRDWNDWNADVDELFPYSSRTVVVDHDKCILCDRCVRACSEVKPFKVIGHTGKGYDARVSFDLDAPMRESSCVQCGECMTSCPTGALSLRRRVQPRAWADSPKQIPQNPNTPFPAGSGFLTADEMLDVWLAYRPRDGEEPRVVFPFRSIPYAYLKWNEGAVRRWEIPAGEKRVICKEGEYGTTAFLLQGTGQFHIHTRGPKAAAAKPGFFGRLLGLGGLARPADRDIGQLIRTVPGDQLVLGEMACLTHHARTATVVAEADPDFPRLDLVDEGGGRYQAVVDLSAEPTAVVYEVTRNLLDMMRRAASAREAIEDVYAARALETCMLAGRLFASLTPEERSAATRFLLDAQTADGARAVEFRDVEPGETVVGEGDAASDFYAVRLGTLRVFRTDGGREQVLNKLAANDHFGEIALLADDLRQRNLLPPNYDTRRRTATVAAIDPSELVRVPGAVFRRMCDRFPAVKEKLIAGAAAIFAAPKTDAPVGSLMAEFVDQGLYQGQKLLALDLVSCTRCDECTRACADSHDGHARLLREGFRFGDFLVATSCRSCHKPYCMEGCPVDAIHRRDDHLEVVIEDHCIGCGLCEKNCPYGSIQMVSRELTVGGPGSAAVAAPRRAVNCDLCGGGEPFCVSACPHDAAFRMDGAELLKEVSPPGGSLKTARG